MTKAVGVFLFESLGAGLLAGNKVGSFAEIQILECVPLGARSLLMIEGTLAAVNGFAQTIQSLGPLRKRVFESLDPKVLQAYYSLSNAVIQETLYVFECDFIGDLMGVANNLFSRGMACVDLRMPRSANTKCYLLMTGPAGVETSGLVENMSMKVTIIDDISAPLRDHFDLTVKS